MPRTWVEVSTDIPDETVKRKYMKLKAERDAKLKFSRWTGKDNI
jgi:hypothetical protein